MPTEASIVEKILAMLRRYGAEANKNHGSPFQPKGRPDIEACLHGRFVAFEVKQPGQAPDRDELNLQLYALERVRAAGGCAAMVESLREAETLIHAWHLI